jgi:hypothetical protein
LPISDRNNFRKKRFILSHGFRSFSSWFLDPVGRTSWWWKCMKEDTSPHGEQEAEQKAGRGQRQAIDPKDMFPVAYFLQLDPIS